MSALDAEQLDQVRELVSLAVRLELARLLGVTTGPPDLPDRPALHMAAPIRAKPLGPLQTGGCLAVVYDGVAYRRCPHPASTMREGHASCGVHAKPQLLPRWADPDGDQYTGI